MKFLIQDNMLHDDNLQKIKDAVINYPYEFVGMVPFSDEITSATPIIGNGYIPYGSTSFIIKSAELGFRGLHFDLKQFNYHEAVKNRKDMLNIGSIVTLEECISILETKVPESEWFVRPSEDLKQFSGQVMNAKDCAEWLKDRMLCASSGSYQLSKDTMIVLAEPKTILAEWRWFIVDGKVISGSLYRKEGQLYKKRETDIDIIILAQQLADGWLPSPCCVMDTAIIEESSDTKIVEFNCINASGFYDNDIQAIFKALWDYHL